MVRSPRSIWFRMLLAAWIGVSTTVAQATSILLVFDTPLDSFPSYDIDGSKLKQLANAAKSQWESLLPENGHNYSVSVHYSEFDASSSTMGVYNNVDHTLNMRSNWTWFLDPTPFEHSEYLAFQEVLAGNLTGVEEASLTGPVPDQLETGYYATAIPGGPADGVTDMFTVLLHEMGHFLEIGYHQFSPNVDLPAQFVGNISGIQAVREDNGHITPNESLMDPTLPSGQRNLPSALDLIVAAHEQNHGSIRPVRVDWIGDALDPNKTWKHDTGWIGGSAPTSIVSATIRHGDTVLVDSDSSAKSVRVMQDSGLSLISHSLLVKQDLWIASQADTDQSHVDVHSDGVLAVEGDLNVRHGKLNMQGGTTYARALIVSGHDLKLLHPRVTGHGAIYVEQKLTNVGRLEADGGSLVFHGTPGVSFDLDGVSSDGQRPWLNASKGNLEFHRALTDGYAGDVTVTGGHALSFVGEFLLDTSSLLRFSSSPGIAEFRSLPAGGVARFRDLVKLDDHTQAQIRADQITFDPTAQVTLGDGADLRLAGPITFRGGTYQGNGVIHQNGDTLVEEDVTLSPATYDWDGDLAVPTTTTIGAGRTMTIATTSLGTGGYQGRTEVGANGALHVELANPFGAWLLGQTGEIRLHQNARWSGSAVIVGGTIAAVEGTSHLDSPMTLTAKSTVILDDHATLSMHAPVVYGGGIVTTDSGLVDNSKLQQYATASVLGPHSITTGFFNWDASTNTSSNTTIHENGILNIHAKEIGNGVTVPIFGVVDRQGFGDQIDIDGGQLWVEVGATDHDQSFPASWTLNESGVMNLNRTDHNMPTVRGSRLVNEGTIRGTGQFFSPLENQGTISVGHPQSIGKILAMNTLELAADGALELDLSGLDAGFTYDQLYLHSSATLAGELAVELPNGFIPAPGDLFRIIDGGADASVTGTFDTLWLPYGTAAWDIVYGSRFVDLRFVAVPEPSNELLQWLALAFVGCVHPRRRTTTIATRSATIHGPTT